MDFHSLSRKELQALCKKNKIPANLTNAAMADSLSNLTKVEGIEEIGQLVSQTPQTCKGSRVRATKDAVISMDNEPTSIAITTRARVRTTQARSNQEDVNDVSLMNLKESTTAAETFETPATRTRRRAISTSVCKGDVLVENAAKEIEKPVGSRYATRRSARLVPENKVPESGRRTKAIKISALSEEEADHLVKKQSFVEKVDAEEEKKGETHDVESGESVIEENSAKGVSEDLDVNSIPEDVAETEHTVSEATNETSSMETANVRVSEATDESLPVPEAEDSIANEIPHAEKVEVLVNDFTVQESTKEVSETTLSLVPDVHVDPVPEQVHEAKAEEYKSETPEDVSMTDVSLVSAVECEEIAKTVSASLVSDAEIAADSVDVLSAEASAEDASSGNADQVQDVDQIVIALEANNSQFLIPGVSLETLNNESNQLLDGDVMDEDASDILADIQLENEKSVTDPMVTEAIAENETEKVVRKVEFDANVSVMETPLRTQDLPSPKSGSKLVLSQGKGTPRSSNKKKPATPFPKMVFKVLEEDMEEHLDEDTSIVDDNKNTNLMVVAADNKENSQGDDTPQRTLKKTSLRQLRKMFKERLVVSADIKEQAVMEKTRPVLKTLTGNCLVEEDGEN